MSTFNHQFVAVAYFCGILSSFQILVKNTLIGFGTVTFNPKLYGRTN